MCRKSTRIEIHTLGAEGLQGVLDVPIYGRITGLELFRPKVSVWSNVQRVSYSQGFSLRHPRVDPKFSS